MSRLRINLFLFIIASLFGAAQAADEYILGPGDIISVTVFNEADMSLPSVRIPNGGMVSFPYVGDIKVSGLTLEKLKSKLIDQLKNGYLKKPQLVISIDQYRSFFVNGQVKSPGGYPFVEGLTVRKAIAIAGGLTDKASLNKMSLLKEGKSNTVTLNHSLDVKISPGDVLTIGESLF